MIFNWAYGIIFCLASGIVFFACSYFPDKVEICAALIQGLFILSAAILVLISGHWAYQAATQKTRLQEQKEEKRRIAYRFMIKEVVSQFINKITPDMEYKNLDDVRRTNGAGTNGVKTNGSRAAGSETDGIYTSDISFPIIRVPESLAIKNWENLAMLDENEISSLIHILSLIDTNNIFAAFSKLGYQTENLKQSREALALEGVAESEIIQGMNRKEFYLNAHTIINTLQGLHANLSVNPVR